MKKDWRSEEKEVGQDWGFQCNHRLLLLVAVPDSILISYSAKSYQLPN